MPRNIECPFGGYIVLPDRWMGDHARRRDEAVAKAEDLPVTFRDFAVAMALVDDWKEIPELDGNPANWDFNTIPWDLMQWVIETVLQDVATSLRVSKKS